ncbi:MAG: HFX_2341 family transcriptional regulator domain-containing protein [Thermoplasmatota archaeon]
MKRQTSARMPGPTAPVGSPPVPRADTSARPEKMVAPAHPMPSPDPRPEFVASSRMHLRVVVACVTFETAMVVKPAQFYRADRVYLLHQALRSPYSDFLREVRSQLECPGRECECVRVNINSFRDAMRAIVRIIRKERGEGNHVYVNISAGPNVFGAAALVACGMEGAIPFTVGVREYTIKDPQVYFANGRPVGLAKDVYDPSPLPELEIRAPLPELVRGLSVLGKMVEQKALMSASSIVKRLEREGLMSNVLDERGRVTQGAVMRYRRRFLEHWLRSGWVAGAGRSLEITELGRSVLDIFG